MTVYKCDISHSVTLFLTVFELLFGLFSYTEQNNLTMRVQNVNLNDGCFPQPVVTCLQKYFSYKAETNIYIKKRDLEKNRSDDILMHVSNNTYYFFFFNKYQLIII